MELHPTIVHFPIALVMVVMLLDIGRWIFDRENLLRAGFWAGSTPLLILALCGALAAVASGLAAEPENTGGVVHDLLAAHEIMAFVSTGLLATLTFWRVGLRGAFPRKAGFLYLFLVLAAAVVVGYGAYFGGQMVYSHGVGVDAVN
ncbi:MAG TPA: DUF2231 domain-containing protein [bacterium]|nr:DUF2231 domain-containing protein [bacterium]